ncbi:MAG: prolipoprotein diacylglyceryl transferase [Ilumatobacter sp.]|nr:prolipoprotein diacylglyceryl transferase [bacterium]MDG1265629.1 prolipoprotein diacylglyceryl transferase [Ilumatobacter sp.]NKB41041.1 prolipoprotein diacylglyceryl transferase [Ilumatobacter sp.]
MSTLASIPSPSFNSIDIGPLSLNIYGLAIAFGVVAGVWLFGRRLEERGAGTQDDASSIAIWAVLAGVIGARLYHVATDWDRFENNYADIPKLWEGGLGIPGGLLFGIPVGLYMAKQRGIPFATAATCAAPAIPLAQAIGRWGNYFNQELYGRPTDLPWALEIDADHLVENPATGELFAVGTTFHPTFLYESLWSLATVFVLLYIDRRWRPSGGSLMGLYLAFYGVGRFWVEGLRVDPADDVGPFRWNQWVALGSVVVGLALFFVLRARPEIEPLGDAPDDSTVGGISLGDDLEGTDSRTKIDPGGDPSTGEPLI